MSSSMRKHLDYIYKRQIRTSRCHQISDDQPLQQSSPMTASASNLSQVVRTQANIANVQRPSSCLEKVAYVEISQQQESERATFDNYKLSEPIEIGISSKTSQTNSRQPQHLQAQSSSDNCLSQSNLTEKKARQHSNNTSGLFRKQNSKSPMSDNNVDSSHVTPRTQIPNMMSSENIHNVILFEHLQ